MEVVGVNRDEEWEGVQESDGGRRMKKKRKRMTRRSKTRMTRKGLSTRVT